MPTSTSRLALTQPAGTDDPSELRLSITANANTLDNAAVYKQGTLVGRPAANTVAAGTFYRCTDAANFSYSDGTIWVPLNLGALTVAAAVKTGITATVTPTKAALGTLVFDPGSNLDLVTNHRYVVPVAGYYSVQAQAEVTSTAGSQWVRGIVYQNGSAVSPPSPTVPYSTASSQALSSVAAGVISCAASDHVEVWVDASTTLSGAVASLTVVRVA